MGASICRCCETKLSLLKRVAIVSCKPMRRRKRTRVLCVVPSWMRVSLHCRFLATRPPAGSLDALEAAATTAQQARLSSAHRTQKSGGSKLGVLHPQLAHVDDGWYGPFGVWVRTIVPLRIDVPGYYTRVVPEHVNDGRYSSREYLRRQKVLALAGSRKKKKVSYRDISDLQSASGRTISAVERSP